MVYLYSTIKMMHGPINLRAVSVLVFVIVVVTTVVVVVVVVVAALAVVAVLGAGAEDVLHGHTVKEI